MACGFNLAEIHTEYVVLQTPWCIILIYYMSEVCGTTSYKGSVG